MKVSNMEFRFTDEQRQIVEMVKGLRRRGSGSDRRRDRQNGRVPRQLVDELAELGLMGMPFPEEYGGAGLDYHALPGGSRGNLSRLWWSRYDRCRPHVAGGEHAVPVR